MRRINWAAPFLPAMLRAMVLTMLLAMLLSAGCAREPDNGFCATHARDHWQHRDQVADLSIRYSADGDLEGRLSLPGKYVGGAEGVLASAENVFTTDASCVAGQQSVTREGGREGGRESGRLVGEYRLHCAGEEPLAALSVPLFDHLAGLEELEVTMATPAVTKHFLIHRSCERAMFNIAQQENGP